MTQVQLQHAEVTDSSKGRSCKCGTLASGHCCNAVLAKHACLQQQQLAGYFQTFSALTTSRCNCATSIISSSLHPLPLLLLLLPGCLGHTSWC